MFKKQKMKEANQPIDIKALREAIRHRVDIEKKLLFILYETAMNDIATLSANVHEETPGEWENAAHGLKGAAANICVDHLAKLCEEAEDTEDTQKRSSLLLEIKAEFDNVKAFIQQLHPHFLEEYRISKEGA